MHLIESFCLQTDEFIIVSFKRTETTSGVLNRKLKNTPKNFISENKDSVLNIC